MKTYLTELLRSLRAPETLCNLRAPCAFVVTIVLLKSIKKRRVNLVVDNTTNGLTLVH